MVILRDPAALAEKIWDIQFAHFYDLMGFPPWWDAMYPEIQQGIKKAMIKKIEVELVDDEHVSQR